RIGYSARLITNFIETLNEWGSQGVDITKIYSIGGTPAGQRILRSAGFKEIGDAGPGRMAFELDIANSDLKILREYKANLERQKKSQEGRGKSKNRKPPRMGVNP